MACRVEIFTENTHTQEKKKKRKEKEKDDNPQRAAAGPVFKPDPTNSVLNFISVVAASSSALFLFHTVNVRFKNSELSVLS